MTRIIKHSRLAARVRKAAAHFEEPMHCGTRFSCVRLLQMKVPPLLFQRYQRMFANDGEDLSVRPVTIGALDNGKTPESLRALMLYFFACYIETDGYLT